MSTRPAPSIPSNLDRYDTTPEITGRICAYRRGEISFAELVDELGKRDYARPSHYDATDWGSEGAESFDHHEAGTTGELRQARSLNLLSDVEYEAIVSAGLRAHGA